MNELRSYWHSQISGEGNVDDTKLLDNIGNLVVADKQLKDKILSLVGGVSHQPASPLNKQKWLDGWGENYAFLNDGMSIQDALIPCYFGKYPFIRVFGEFISSRPVDCERLDSLISSPPFYLPQAERRESLEYILYCHMMDQLIFLPFLEYCRINAIFSPTICDLGAGTCHNIYRFDNFLRKHGLSPCWIATDWSSSTGLISSKLVKSEIVPQLEYIALDYYDKSTWAKLSEYNIDMLYSIASLEQFGGNIMELLGFIEGCGDFQKIHIEPIREALSVSTESDLQSRMYMQNRKYLSNLPASLLTLEMNLKRPLLKKMFRTGLGSLFIDGYTYVKWQ